MNSSEWFAGFAGVDYIHDKRWAFCALYNYADDGDFDGHRNGFRGIKMNALSLGASYYFMRNLTGVFEITIDLLSEERGGPPFVGHQTKEHYALIDFDAAY